MTYVLGTKSLQHLQGVHPKLDAVVRLAISQSAQDFTVQEGLRSSARQRLLVASGASKTLDSKHLEQPDGFGHAVDLVPWIDGTPRWEWGPIYHIAAAMREAAIICATPIVWGGVWDRRLNDLPSGSEGIKAAVAEYCVRHPGPDWLDGPHYQLAVTR